MLRKVAKRLGWFFGGLASLALIFLLTSWIGSSIPRGKTVDNPANPVTIMIETNGAHTQIVVPVANDMKDWRETFPTASNPVRGRPPTHLSLGYGETEVFLNTPTLSDLKLSTALRVGFMGGDGLIRVTNLANPPLSEYRRELDITKEQYRALVDVIMADLPSIGDAGFRSFVVSQYDPYPYYDAVPDYTVVFTCNQWTSDRLAQAGIRTGWFTPFSGGVMKWVPPHSRELPTD